MTATTLNIDGAALELTDAELYFLDQCAIGEWAEYNNNVRPYEAKPDVWIRAALVRFALLGGNRNFHIHWRGPRIRGAWISGRIELNLCKTDFALTANNCVFEKEIDLFDAEIFGVDLNGSWCPGIKAYRLKTKGPVLLEDEFHSAGEIDLDYARIDGRLGLSTARLTPDEGKFALTAAATRIRDDVSLSGANGVRLVAKGAVMLRAAKIGGQLKVVEADFSSQNQSSEESSSLYADGIQVSSDVVVRSSSFTKNVCFRAAMIKGQFQIEQTKIGGIFDLNSAIIKQKLVLDPQEPLEQSGPQNPVIGSIDLRLAKVGALYDNERTWKAFRKICIAGLTYDDIESDISWGTRMDDMVARDEVHVLASNSNHTRAPVHEVSPQPFTFWARQLDAQGYRLQASWVRFKREDLLRNTHYAITRKRFSDHDYPPARLISKQHANWWWLFLKAELRRLLDLGFGFFFGYGHQPGRAVLTVFCIWFFSVWLYGTAYDKGQMAPNSDVILVSKEWQEAITHKDACPLRDYDVPKPAEQNCVQPLKIWTGIKENSTFEPSNASQDYENFNRYLYALDLFVPLDSLGQELAWVPARDRGMWGWWAYSLRWLIQMAGWIFTAVGAATITGLLARKE